MKTLPFFLLTLLVGCDDNSAELSKLNSDIKILSDRTEGYENQIKEIKVEASDEKARFDNEKIDLVSKIKDLEIELKKLSDEKKAFEEKEQILDRIIVDLGEQKMKTAQEHQDFVDTLVTEHKQQMAAMQREIRKADAMGYKRGIAEMLSRIDKSRGN
jgi:predicted  nucleic acid-binding Zn-ribbon protein